MALSFPFLKWKCRPKKQKYTTAMTIKISFGSIKANETPEPLNNYKKNCAMNDKQAELLADAIQEGSSNCCGAKVYIPDICAECKEHCEIITDEE